MKENIEIDTSRQLSLNISVFSFDRWTISTKSIFFLFLNYLPPDLPLAITDLITKSLLVLGVERFADGKVRHIHVPRRIQLTSIEIFYLDLIRGHFEIVNFFYSAIVYAVQCASVHYLYISFIDIEFVPCNFWSIFSSLHPRSIIHRKKIIDKRKWGEKEWCSHPTISSQPPVWHNRLKLNGMHLDGCADDCVPTQNNNCAHCIRTTFSRFLFPSK